LIPGKSGKISKMKAKLLKTAKGHYVLVDETKETYDKGFLIGTSRESDVNKLSLNNCLEIENRYDLSALFCEVDESIDYQEFDFTSFRLGFQKALEFLNKKFSEEDMINYAWYVVKTMGEYASHEGANSSLAMLKVWQSLQQTEWDVEVEMICPHPMDTYRCGLQYGCDGDGCNHPEQVPSLDHDGCLILKRI